MILDCHIHMNDLNTDKAEFKKNLELAGIDGGIVLSFPPSSFYRNSGAYTPLQRLKSLMELTKDDKYLFPFYWIDPTEKDAADQVDMAIDMGVKGFKVICNTFFPYDPRAMKIYKAIAEKGKPMIFHSGILWDGRASSGFNRPANFEALLEVEGLRFALAHISWPWVDECIAVYGKLLHAVNQEKSSTCEMFIDNTPGTPGALREEALTRLFKVRYGIEDHLMFGVDGETNNYRYKLAREWIDRDNAIYEKLGVNEEAKDLIWYRNLLKFVGGNQK